MDLKAATRLSKRLAANGFLALGGFHPAPGEISLHVDGTQVPARTVLLIGNAGAALWQAFAASPESADGGADPLDRYTRRTLDTIAAGFALASVYPFTTPYQPFQQWAMKAGGFSQSPLGVLAHRRYGPWAAFRAAFLSPELFGRFEAIGIAGPCETCAAKPCLSACPVGAIRPDGYDVSACRGHLGAHPAAECFAGCLARAACPVGADFRPPAALARLHMRAFLG